MVDGYQKHREKGTFVLIGTASFFSPSISDAKRNGHFFYLSIFSSQGQSVKTEHETSRLNSRLIRILLVIVLARNNIPVTKFTVYYSSLV